MNSQKAKLTKKSISKFIKWTSSRANTQQIGWIWPFIQENEGIVRFSQEECAYAISTDNHNIEWGLGYAQKKSEVIELLRRLVDAENKLIHSICVWGNVIWYECKDGEYEWEQHKCYIHKFPYCNDILSQENITQLIKKSFPEKLAKVLLTNKHNKYLIKQLSRQMVDRSYIDEDQYNILCDTFDFLDKKVKLQ